MFNIDDYPTIAEIAAMVTDAQRAEIQREIDAGTRCPHGQRDPYATCTPCSRCMTPPPLTGLCYHGYSWDTCPVCTSR